MSNTRIPSAAVPYRLVVPVAALLVAILAGCSDKPQIDHELTATLIQPVARVEVIAVAEEEEAVGDRDGATIYQAVCTACHATAVAGAPKTGDADAWAPRIAKGLDANIQSVINGLGAMPPRGGNPTLTDDEVRRAVVYLANQAGADFSE